MTEIKKFVKRPVEVEAVQFEGTSESAFGIINWILNNNGSAFYICLPVPVLGRYCTGKEENHALEISTLEGRLNAVAGDFIIKGIQGEFYPCKPDVFEATYEAIVE